MYNTQYPNEYLDYCMRPGREWKVEIPEFSEYTGYTIKNIQIENTLGDKQTFTIGGCLMSYMKLELNINDFFISSFRNLSLHPIVKLRTMVMIEGVLTEVWQSVPLGEYIVSSYEKKNGVSIKLECHDKMCHDKYGHKKYYREESFPVSSKDIVIDICEKLNCEYIESSIPVYTLNHPEKINGKNIHYVLKYIATLYGGFCKFNREGKLEFFKLTNTNVVHRLEHGVREINENENTLYIKGIKCQTSVGENFITAGEFNDEDRLIQISNYDMTQSRLNEIYNEYKNYNFYSLDTEVKFNPAFEVGDIITIQNQNNTNKQILLQTFTYTVNGGPTGNYICDYDLDSEDFETISPSEDYEEELIDEPIEEIFGETFDDIFERLEELENDTTLENEIRDIYGRMDDIRIELDNLHDHKDELDPIYEELASLDLRVTALEEIFDQLEATAFSMRRSLGGLLDETLFVNTSKIITMDVNGYEFSFDYDPTIISVTNDNVNEGTISITGLTEGNTILRVYVNVEGFEYETLASITCIDKVAVSIDTPILVDFDSDNTLTFTNNILLSSRITQNEWDIQNNPYGFTDTLLKGVLYQVPSNIFTSYDGYLDSDIQQFYINVEYSMESFYYANEENILSTPNNVTLDPRVMLLMKIDNEYCIYDNMLSENYDNDNENLSVFSCNLGSTDFMTDIRKGYFSIQTSPDYIDDHNIEFYVFIGGVISTNSENPNIYGRGFYIYDENNNYRRNWTYHIGNRTSTNGSIVNTVTDSNILNVNSRINSLNIYLSNYLQS